VARASHSLITRENVEFRDREALLKLEPWIAKHEGIVAATHEISAARAVCGTFTRRVAKEAREKYGVKFIFNIHVEGLEVSAANEVTGLRLSGSDVVPLEPGTAVVVAGGSWCVQLLRTMGLYCPIYPLKGYDLLVDIEGVAPEEYPQHIVIDDDHVYYAAYGNTLRIAAVGEFAGWTTIPDEAVAADLRRVAKEFLPHLAERIDKAPVVCGLRPYVADGFPLIGGVDGFSNLYVNSGPGFNGWKTGLGAGEVRR
jgi:D-amino-acid dehydrogenase